VQETEAAATSAPIETNRQGDDDSSSYGCECSICCPYSDPDTDEEMDYGSRAGSSVSSEEDPDAMFDTLSYNSRVGDSVYACPGYPWPVLCVILSIVPKTLTTVQGTVVAASAEVVLCACDEHTRERLTAGESFEVSGPRFSQRLSVGEIFRINFDMELGAMRRFRERKSSPKELLSLPSASRMDALAVYESLLDTEIAAMAQFTTGGLKTRGRFYKK
jgi:hypothetical protein